MAKANDAVKVKVDTERVLCDDQIFVRFDSKRERTIEVGATYAARCPNIMNIQFVHVWIFNTMIS